MSHINDFPFVYTNFCLFVWVPPELIKPVNKGFINYQFTRNVFFLLREQIFFSRNYMKHLFQFLCNISDAFSNTEKMQLSLNSIKRNNWNSYSKHGEWRTYLFPEKMNPTMISLYTLRINETLNENLNSSCRWD